MANAVVTADLVTRLSRNQANQPVPSQVASMINTYVGENFLGQAYELRDVANRVREKAWLDFFNNELLPKAIHGAFSVEFRPDWDLLYDANGNGTHWYGFRELRYFWTAHVFSEKEIEDLARGHGFWFDYELDAFDHLQWCEFSWSWPRR